MVWDGLESFRIVLGGLGRFWVVLRGDEKTHVVCAAGPLHRYGPWLHAYSDPLANLTNMPL